jgi:hypothetical protein
MLLVKRVTQPFLDHFTELIESEGRQPHILDLLATLIKVDGKYIFDNQLLVLNSFIPQGRVTER